MTDDFTPEPGDPTVDEAREAAAKLRDEWQPDPEAVDLPADVRDGEAHG